MKYYIKILTLLKEEEYPTKRDIEIDDFISNTQKDILYNTISKEFIALKDRDNWKAPIIIITSDEEIKPNDWILQHDKELEKFDFNSDLQEIVDRVNYWQKNGLYKKVIGKASQVTINKLINGELRDGDEVNINNENKPIPFLD